MFSPCQKLPFNVCKSFFSFLFLLFILSASCADANEASFFNDYENLPKGELIHLTSKYNPLIIKGLFVYPDDPLKMDFIIDAGDQELTPEEFSLKVEKVVRYFLASLTIPKTDLWVNLTPYEKDRIISPYLAQTEMGRDMLSQDYMLKQLSASLLYPEGDVGKRFWDRVRTLAKGKYDVDNLPVDLFNKVWIIPEEANLFENEKGVYILNHRLKVMLEEDYFAATKYQDQDKRKSAVPSTIIDMSSDLVQEIILPELEKEVNQGEIFANLRQIFNSLILATWYKNELKTSILSQHYANQNKIAGIDVVDKEISQRIYNQYIASIKKGAFEYIREEYDPATRELVNRKYVSGGIAANQMHIKSYPTLDEAMATEIDGGQDRLKRVTVKLNNGPIQVLGILPPHGVTTSDERSLLHEKAIRLREESMDSIRNQYGKAFAYPDFSISGVMQDYLETLFLPWARGRQRLEANTRDFVSYPFWNFMSLANQLTYNFYDNWIEISSWMISSGLGTFPSFSLESEDFQKEWKRLLSQSFIAPSISVNNIMMDYFWNQWKDHNRIFNPFWEYLEPSFKEAETLKKYFQENYSKMMDPSENYPRKVSKTIEYLQSIEGKKPEYYSKHTEAVRVPGLFKLVRVESKEGQEIDENLPPALIIGPHSGHDAESLADYTNKDKTDANSLAQTFKKQGYDTYILVWESSDALQDIGDLQEAVHLSVRTIGKKVVIAGLCHGGAVGSHYAAVNPDQVAGLIVAGSPEDTHIGDNDVTRYAEKGMEMPAWLQFGQGQKDVLPGDVQKFSFKYLGFEGGVHKRITSLLELIENIDDIEYVDRARIFDEWFEYTNNIGYLSVWVDDIFIENSFVKGELSFRFGQKEVIADPRNYNPNMPIASIEGYKDDITPPPTISFVEVQKMVADPEALWNFLTKGIVSRKDLDGIQIQRQPAFDYLLENGLIDNSNIEDKDYAYVNEETVIDVMTKIFQKNNAYRFMVKDFQNRNDTAETVLPKIQALIDVFVKYTGEKSFQANHYSQAIKWLNANAEIFKIMDSDEIKTLDADLLQAIEDKFGKSFDAMEKGELIKLSKSFEGMKFKRLIVEHIAPELKITNEKKENAKYQTVLDQKTLEILRDSLMNRYFSDSDVQSVNSVRGEKAVMRMPFLEMAFKKDLQSFKSIDAPFVRKTQSKDLDAIFNHLSSIRGQSSGLFKYVPTKEEYLLMFLTEGGHIGIYNGSKSQKTWVKILNRFKDIWKEQGMDSYKFLLPSSEIVLAIQDNAVYPEMQDVAMSTEVATPNKDELGGIDFNPDLLSVKIRRTNNGVTIPRFEFSHQDSAIESLTPSVINVSPLMNLPSLLGIKQ